MCKSSIVACAVTPCSLFSAVQCDWDVACGVVAWHGVACPLLWECDGTLCLPMSNAAGRQMWTARLKLDVVAARWPQCPVSISLHMLVHAWVILAVHTFQWLLPTVANLLFLVYLKSSAQHAQCSIHSTSEHSFQQSADALWRYVLHFHLAEGSGLLKVVLGLAATIEFCCHHICHQHRGSSRGHQTFIVQFLRNHPYLVMASTQDWVMFLSFRYELIRNMGGLVGSHADVCTFFQQAMLSYY